MLRGRQPQRALYDWLLTNQGKKAKDLSHLLLVFYGPKNKDRLLLVVHGLKQCFWLLLGCSRSKEQGKGALFVLVAHGSTRQSLVLFWLLTNQSKGGLCSSFVHRSKENKATPLIPFDGLWANQTKPKKKKTLLLLPWVLTA